MNTQSILLEIKKDLALKAKSEIIEDCIKELEELYKQQSTVRDRKSKKYKDLDKKIKYMQSKVYVLRASQLNAK